MGESTGQIVFVNSHDYVSDILGTPFIGCMANLRGDDGPDVVLYTTSLRLHHTLEMAYATKSRVTVDYFDGEVSLDEQRGLDRTAARREPSSDFLGPFTLKALWTLE
jgi:hypothetical protein